MFTKLLKSILNFFSVFCILSNLEAVDIRTEFRKSEDLTQDQHDILRTFGHDCTLVILEGVPPNSKIESHQAKFTEKFKPTKVPDLIAAPDGTAVWVVSGIGFVPGELLKFTFQCGEKIKKEVSFVPCPITAKSSVDKAQVTAVLHMLSPDGYSLKLEGFKKNEKVELISVSDSETIKHTIVVDQMLEMGSMPGVLHKKGGTAKLSFKRASGEILSLELPWGYEKLKYLMYYENEIPKRLIDSLDYLKSHPEIKEYFNET